jgi:simple sugar transport system ATP-binding protein
MDVAENLFLGREEVRRVGRVSTGILRRRAMVQQSGQHLAELGVSVPTTHGLQVDRLSGGQQQGVATARALTWESGVLIMDEPTAALGVKQSEAVLDLARRVAERGSAVLFITHTLPYVMRFADRVVVMRHARKVADLPREDTTAEGLVSLMVGLGSEGPPVRPDSSSNSLAERVAGDRDE